MHRVLKFILMVPLFVSASAFERDEIEAYWPCAQRYIDTVYADVYWPEAAVLSDDARLEDDAIINAAMVLANEYESEDARNQAISSVKDNYTGNPVEVMALVFVATLNILNEERTRYLNSIIKHEKGQEEIADSLEESLNRIDQIEAGEPEKLANELKDLKTKVEWQQRIFQQRNNQIISMCELPVEVEERLSVLAQRLREAT